MAETSVSQKCHLLLLSIGLLLMAGIDSSLTGKSLITTSYNIIIIGKQNNYCYFLLLCSGYLLGKSRRW